MRLPRHYTVAQIVDALEVKRFSLETQLGEMREERLEYLDKERYRKSYIFPWLYVKYSNREVGEGDEYFDERLHKIWVKEEELKETLERLKALSFYPSQARVELTEEETISLEKYLLQGTKGKEDE